MEAAELALEALGDPTRRALLRLLASGPRTVGALAGPLSVSRPAVSQHLRVLEGAHLVRFEAEGRRHLYRLDPEGFNQTRQWLDSLWPLALDRFAALAEVERQPHNNRMGAI